MGEILHTKLQDYMFNHSLVIELVAVAVILGLSHFGVMWHWASKYKVTLGSALRSLEVQSYKTVNEVRLEAGLPALPPEMGGNMVLNRLLIEALTKRNLL